MPSFRPRSRVRSGFTMMEALVAIALCGLLAVFLVPKLMSTQGNEQAIALIQDTYTAIGEMYLSREQDSSVVRPGIGTGATAPKNSNEGSVFGQYLQDHLRVKSSIVPAGNNYCTSANDYFVLQSGVMIRRICDDTPDITPDALQITVRIPNNDGSNTDFIIAVPEGSTSGKSQGRYTTLYGFKKDNGLTINAGDCGVADKILKLTTDCS